MPEHYGRQTLTIDTIGNINGGTLRVAANTALKQLAQDLHDRPTLDKTRTLIIKIDMKPVIDPNSSAIGLDSVDFSWQICQKQPAIGSAGVVMKPQQDGQLYFHSDIPDSPNDQTIMDEAERRQLERRERERSE